MLLLALFLGLIVGAWTVEKGSTRCDGLSEPIGISNTKPYLSWRMLSDLRHDGQTAYQIQVTSHTSSFQSLLWDSGKVNSKEFSALYAGHNLSSRTLARWRVRAWDSTNRISAWSDTAFFEVGLHADDWKANWIANNQYTCGLHSLPVFRKSFSVSCAPIKGRLYLLGMGQHAATINGKDISDSVLAPGYSNINKTLLYSTYNVTTRLTQGANNIQVELGKGIYDPEPALHGRYMKFNKAPKQLKLISQLEYFCVDGSNGVVVSDNTWYTTLEGPRIESSWYGGEEYDARKKLASPIGLEVNENETANRKTDQLLSTLKTKQANTIGVIPIHTKAVKRSGMGQVYPLDNIIQSTIYQDYFQLGRHFGRKVVSMENHTVLPNNDMQTAANTQPSASEQREQGREQTHAQSSVDGNRSIWFRANNTSSPSNGILQGSQIPPLKIIETFPAVSVAEVNGKWIIDLGRNFAGWYTVKLKGPAGTRVTIFPSELLAASGEINQTSTGFPIYDGYTLCGEAGESFTPKFMYHGFRYLQLNTTVVPDASDVVGIRINTKCEPVGTFSSSNPLFNEIHNIIDRAIQSNMYSVLTDCPHREKLGWLEETHLVFDPVARGYDVQALGRGLLKNIAEAQTLDGLIPDIAPEYIVFWDPYRDDPNWGNAIIRMALQLYQTYKETQLLQDYYEAMQQYVNYLTSKASNNVLDYGLADWFAFDVSTSSAITATFGYQQAVSGMITIADALGRKGDIKRYSQLNRQILSSFHAKFYDEQSGSYGSGSQGCDAMALDMGAVPEEYYDRVLDNLVKSVESFDYHFSVGEVALPSLFRSLGKGNRNDILYLIMTQTSHPSYGYQVTHGATSLTEAWDGPTFGVSQNHFMMGYADTWLNSLAGISQAEESIGWDHIHFKPLIVGDLTAAHSTYRSTHGMVSASWMREGQTFIYNITVPVGSQGTVFLPYEDIKESTQVLTEDSDIRTVRSDTDGVTHIAVGSGEYFFSAVLHI